MRTKLFFCWLLTLVTAMCIQSCTAQDNYEDVTINGDHFSYYYNLQDFSGSIAESLAKTFEGQSFKVGEGCSGSTLENIEASYEECVSEGLIPAKPCTPFIVVEMNGYYQFKGQFFTAGPAGFFALVEGLNGYFYTVSNSFTVVFSPEYACYGRPSGNYKVIKELTCYGSPKYIAQCFFTICEGVIEKKVLLGFFTDDVEIIDCCVEAAEEFYACPAIIIQIKEEES